MDTGQLSYAIWLSLPNEVRHKLVTLFDIPRSGMTIVDYRATGAVVTSDGYTAPDLQAISLSRMQSLLGSESDNYYKLFERTVENIDPLLSGTYAALIASDGEVLFEGKAPTIESMNKSVSNFVKTPEFKALKKSLFCDSCDSKGVRHKKLCPKNRHA